VLLASVAFSFIFPTIQTLLWYDVWSVKDSRFINIQFWIIIVIFIFSFIFRKYFYLPITSKVNTYKFENKEDSLDEKKNDKIISEEKTLDKKVVTDEIKIKKEYNTKPEIRNSSRWYIDEEVEKKVIRINDNEEIIDNSPDLDIKVWKEII